jgi:tetraacyldisaccharide 4'-kinase
MIEAWVTEAWYRPRHWLSYVVRPLSWLYCAVAHMRRWLYLRGWLKHYTVSVPVVVVGNITVGGTGKTPLLTSLVQDLRARGMRPGIISRGYGGQAKTWPQAVTADSLSLEVGDEPVLLARRTGVPMMVGPDRVASAEALLRQSPEVNVILSDDGLQHYRLTRDVEIAVCDGQRLLGNRLCLPAGPLREPPSRLNTVDAIVYKGGSHPDGVTMHVHVNEVYALHDQTQRRVLTDFSVVHAVSGIGNPKSFFDSLGAAGLSIYEHPFPDHHPYQTSDVMFPDNLPVLVTEKDAVKLERFATLEHIWVVSVTAVVDDAWLEQLYRNIHG